MPETSFKGVRIYYEDTGGAGPPVILVHGLGSGLEQNWRASGWLEALVNDRRRAIALDCRGHGKSDKPHEADAYAGGVMAEDVLAVMDAAGIVQADFIGYSMGGTIVLDLLLRHREKARCAVLGGFGLHDLATVGPELEAGAGALLAEDPPSIENPGLRASRQFLEATGQDLLALAALPRGQALNEDEEGIRGLEVPLLIACGEADPALEGARRLASTAPRASLVTVPGANHITMVADPRFKDAVLPWLREHRPRSSPAGATLPS